MNFAVASEAESKPPAAQNGEWTEVHDPFEHAPRR